MMETGTFLKENVLNYLEKYFIPLKYEPAGNTEQFIKFGVKGTPTYLVLDSKGNEIYRALGAYGPDDFIGQLEKARANVNPVRRP